MYFYGPTHMAKQKQDDQLEHINSSYVRIRDVALKTGQRRWTIGRSGERGSGISVLAARYDDDDIYIYIKYKKVIDPIKTCWPINLSPKNNHPHTCKSCQKSHRISKHKQKNVFLKWRTIWFGITKFGTRPWITKSLVNQPQDCSL